MLHEELRDSDLPGWTHIRTCVAEVWDEHMAKLEQDMTVCFFFISNNFYSNLIPLLSLRSGRYL